MGIYIYIQMDSGFYVWILQILVVKLVYDSHGRHQRDCFHSASRRKFKDWIRPKAWESHLVSCCCCCCCSCSCSCSYCSCCSSDSCCFCWCSVKLMVRLDSTNLMTVGTGGSPNHRCVWWFKCNKTPLFTVFSAHTQIAYMLILREHMPRLFATRGRFFMIFLDTFSSQHIETA